MRRCDGIQAVSVATNETTSSTGPMRDASGHVPEHGPSLLIAGLSETSIIVESTIRDNMAGKSSLTLGEMILRRTNMSTACGKQEFVRLEQY